MTSFPLPLPSSPTLKKKLTRSDLIKAETMQELLQIPDEEFNKWVQEFIEAYKKDIKKQATITTEDGEKIVSYLETYLWLQYLGLEPTVENFPKLRIMQGLFYAKGKQDAIKEIVGATGGAIAIPIILPHFGGLGG